MKKAVKITLGVLGGFLALLIILFAVAWKIYLNPRVEEKATVPLSNSQTASSDAYKNVKYIAHRGSSATAPENTLPAIELAGKRGYYGAEFDVYCTKDGKWVLMHDPFLFRMTDGFWQISKYTYDELLEFSYDNGANYEDYPDLKITLLSDALDMCRKYNLEPCVEIKGSNTENISGLLDLLNDKGYGDCTILSFKLEQLQAVRKYSNNYRLWYLVHTIEQEDIDAAKALGGKTGIDFNASKEKNTAEIIQAVANSGLDVGAWTIDDVETLEKMLDYGVKYITTNTILPND